MPVFRIDYITSRERGIWDYEREYTSLTKVREILPETLKYARKKMPEIEELIVVKINEKIVDRLKAKYPNEAPMFAPDGTMLDEHGNRSIFDDIDK